MSSEKWIYFDALIFLIQLLLIVRYVLRKRAALGKLNAGGLGFGALMLIAPVGLFPVGIVSISLRDSLPREIFWHIKIFSGVSFLDLVGMFFFGALLAHLVLYVRGKVFLILFAGIFFVFVVGLCSAINAPFGFDLKLIMNSFRTVMLVLSGFIFGYRLSGRRTNWQLDYVLLMSILTLLSMISMVFLASYERGERYWTHAILQSQAGTLVAAFAFVLLLFTNELKKKSIACKILVFSMPFIIAIGGGVKGMMASLGVCLIFYLLSLVKVGRLASNFILKSNFISVFLICFFYSGILIINSKMFNISSIDTRYFQVANALATLQSGGVSSLLFGIGWKQWYIEILSFPLMDFGAWTDEEIALPGMKNSIQLLPFSMIRSVGILGFFVFFMLMCYVFSLYKFGDENKNSAVRDFILCFFLISEMFAIPDIIPEAAFFSSLMLFSGIKFRNYGNDIRYCKGMLYRFSN